jgi:phosphocarrier protein FPr
VRDLCARVLGHLHGRPSAPPPPLEAPSILLLAELTPSEAAALDPRRTLAVCMARGGPTAHSVILARRLGVPTVVALGDALLDIVDGALLAVDGDSGEVVIAPDGALQAAYAVRELAGRERRTAAHAARALPATTRDGHRVQVLANVASLGDAHAALDQGAEGIGLLRTELLYLARDRPPSEDEQVAAYRAFFDALGPRPVVVRTFDIGGDKPARYLDVPAEPNPALGRRGLRLALEHPALLSAQLRAVLRAAEGRAARLMFPMVTTPDELRRARALLVHASAELRAAGLPQADQVACGVMIEVPAAALLAGALAPLADFFSIGTNDLAQFTLAADRTNARTAELADSLHPAVLMLVERAVQAAHAHGKPVAMCGELAGDPQAVPILLGLGVDELSANAASVPGVKAAIREVSLDKARALARRALQQESAAAVRSLLR